MKVLILSVDPWCQKNSFGNTYSNIFGKIENIEIAHIYLLDGLPSFERNVLSYYQIPESELIKSVFKAHTSNNSVGREVSPIADKDRVTSAISEELQEPRGIYRRLLQFGKKHHWQAMFTAREIAWKMGNLNYSGLFSFIDKFQPDLFLLAYYNVFNSNRIALRIKKRFDIPMVMVMMMDHYSLKRISLNPFFWLDRFAKRARIRKLVSISEMMFVISKKLKEEIESELHIPCKILYKTPDENRAYLPYSPNNNRTKSYLFTGNIYANRWKTLAILAKELKKQGGGKLDIYTATPISKRMDKALNIAGISETHAPVSQEEVIALQNQADILVHVEAFDKFNKSLVRCAISTKIMDYLSVGRCILAIGPSDISSMEYLSENDLALTACNKTQLGDVVSNINANHSIINKYALKGRDFSSNNLNASYMREVLYNDLHKVVDNYKQ